MRIIALCNFPSTRIDKYLIKRCICFVNLATNSDSYVFLGRSNIGITGSKLTLGVGVVHLCLDPNSRGQRVSIETVGADVMAK
jgi:hypothetical protein